MATVEVNLQEGEAPPEQHLEEGEHIERLVVPLSELYHKLKGTYFLAQSYHVSRAYNDGCFSSVVAREGHDSRCKVSDLAVPKLHWVQG